MLSVKGTYENGIVKLDRTINIKKTSKVIVTFLEEETEIESGRLSKEDFSFMQSRESSNRYKSNISDAIIEERRSDH